MKIINISFLILILYSVCEKSQQLKSCWHTFAYKEIPEGGTDPVFLNYKRGGERTVDFICHKNGERIVCKCFFKFLSSHREYAAERDTYVLQYYS